MQMKYGFSLIAVIPVREEPDETAELGTQVLFGERFVILEENDKWSRIRLASDKYTGWIDKKMITYIDSDQFRQNIQNEPFVFKGLFTKLYFDIQFNNGYQHILTNHLL